MRFLCVLLVCVCCAGLDAAVFTVTNTNDSGAGSLRQAVADANALAGNDTVSFTLPNPSTITLASGLTCSDSLDMMGPGARQLTVTASGTGYRFCLVNNGAAMSVSDMTIQGFQAAPNSGGAFGTTSAPAPSSVIMFRTAVRNCSATSAGVAQVNGLFAAIDCEFSGNQATTGAGGVMSSSGLGIILQNCTFSGNSAATNGGCIMLFAGSLDMVCCTFGGNTATGSGGAINRAAAAGAVTLDNTILSGNTAPTGPNAVGTITSAGFNLVSDATGMTFTALATDIVGQNAQLQPIADNGGPTNTMALGMTSPAIDAGDGSAASVTTDQRGVTRPRNISTISPQPTGFDIGAYEMNPTMTAVSPTLAFGSINTGQFSAAQSFTVNGKELVAAVVITPPAHYQLSTSAAGPFAGGPLNLTPSASGAVQQTVHVRYAPTVVGAHNGNIVVTSVDVPPQQVAVTGDGVNPLSPVVQVTGVLSAFVVPAVGVASVPQSYTVQGNDLTAAITVTAPAGFQVSLAAASGFAASVNTTAPVANVVPATTIHVRYNPASGTSHAGDVSNASAGATTQLMAASGTVVTPVITVTGTLNAFVTTAVNVPSPEQSYTVEGTDLVAAVDVTAPFGFQVSLTSGTGFALSLLSPAPVAGALAPTTIFVRYNPSIGTSHMGDIAHASLHAAAQVIAASGTVVAPPPPPPPAITVTGTLSPFTTVLGTPSAEQSYTVSGANLVFAIGISAPTGFEVSLTSGSGFATALNTPAPAAGTVPPTTIFVRYNPASGSTHGGNLSHTSTGATTQTRPVSGTAANPLPPNTSVAANSTSCAAQAGAAWAALLPMLALLRRRRR